MPANLTPQYKRAEDAYRQAKTTPEKIEAIEDMMRVIPKHKGTEHIRADLKKRLAKLRSTDEQQKRNRGGTDIFFVEKHGAGQILAVGMPNSGKSALVGKLTKARVNIAPYPYATHAPVPGMMPFEDIQIQFVDMPPVTSEGLVTGMMGGLERADALLICLDLSAPDLLEQAENCFGVMAERGLFPTGKAAVEGMNNKPMLTLGTKVDLPDTADNLDALLELRPDLGPVHPVSTETELGLDVLPKCCFELLDIVRIYSKQPGKPADKIDPFTLPRGRTVVDFARAVHREIAADLKYARVWGSGKFAGQTVQRDHIMEDGDIVELHV
ncbi:MAG: TGS domain-containing protein [Lentisphaerae bacterium]|jgi:uncharacterized protein|nr:TGS domain-containing protein [Lentisphaerota bacterium]MBT4820626.1 TGS domain-containing protein [Lentisphaerota bacterium]MBT5607073.1 TGS domain-containing protein [Lentisphaerota bacterium]MBT7061621.1 TGS domain-containing protein [Lentisphaerota bacterium]MBT7845897.1 TGS domain-containing protein [Lentisphaerota bacterium]